MRDKYETEHVLVNEIIKEHEFGKNFPVSETIRSDILDARTIARSSQWWTAVLLFNNPKNDSTYITLYKWKLSNGDWKRASSFKINSSEHLCKIIKALEGFQGSMSS